MAPLDSQTKTGKIVDEVIAALSPIVCIKSNLFDLNHLPIAWSNKDVFKWKERVQYNPDMDVVFTLGAVVGTTMEKVFGNQKGMIQVAHPSSLWAKEKREKWVDDIIYFVQKHQQFN